jgi:hypothetical protein
LGEISEFSELKVYKGFSFMFSSVALLAYQFIHMMNEGDGVRERKREEREKKRGGEKKRMSERESVRESVRASVRERL